jgi:hypothetical protein
MIKPIMSVSRTGVPVFSKIDLEELGEAYVRDYQPSMFSGEEPFQAERFATEYLKLEVEYQWLSNNGCYLGAAVLGEGQEVILYDPDIDRPFRREYPLGTVLLDASLQELSREGIMRFTLLHECAHQVLHRSCYQSCPDAVACRSAVLNGEIRDPEKAWTDGDWMEWQANYLASCLLMPISAVRACIRENGLDEYYQYRVNRGMLESNAFRMAAFELAPMFRVSDKAAESRLRALGFGKG